MPNKEFEDVLTFWFPQGLRADHATMVQQFEWWFRGVADSAIIERFAPLLERVARGELDYWAQAPRSRLALIRIATQSWRANQLRKNSTI